jgi:hypothetical protein
MPDALRKTFGIVLLVFFLLGFLPLGFGSRPADALAKKKVVRKIKYKKKAPRKAKIKKVRRKVKKAIVKTKIKSIPSYRLPTRSGVIAQNYILKEKVDEAQAERIVSELRSLGAEEASYNVNTNNLRVKFNTRELSAVGIMTKIKGMGYTIKRIE